jgi:hypothetical protein
MHAEAVDEGESLRGIALCPVEGMTVLWSSGSSSHTQRIGDLGPLTAGQVAFGVHVRLECGDLYNSYHVRIPMSGQIESEHVGVRGAAHAEFATVC